MDGQLSVESKMEKFIKIAFYSFIILGLVLLLGKKSWWPDFYNPIFLGWVFLVCAFLIRLPKYIFKTNNQCKQGAVIMLSAAIALALILNGLGELYLYKLYQYGIQYDKLIHFSTTFMSVVVLASFLEIWFEQPFKKAVGLAIFIVLAGGLIWEVFEFSSDLFFKTSEFGVYGQYKFSDTIFDILSDILGVVSSSIYLLAPFKRRSVVNEYRHCVAK